MICAWNRFAVELHVSLSFYADELQATAGSLSQNILDGVAVSSPPNLAQLQDEQKRLNTERKLLVKEIAKEKRKRKRILEKTKALSETDLFREIVQRRERAAAQASTAPGDNSGV